MTTIHPVTNTPSVAHSSDVIQGKTVSRCFLIFQTHAVHDHIHDQYPDKFAEDKAAIERILYSKLHEHANNFLASNPPGV